MAVLTSSQLTFIDITDQRQLSTYLTSNLTTVQIYDVDSGFYNPDWSANNLELTPQIFLDQNNLDKSDPNLRFRWWKKEGNSTETEIANGSDGMSISRGTLTVSTNKLGAIDSGMLTFICEITYRDSESNQDVVAKSQLCYTLLKTVEKNKSCTIEGPQAFKYTFNNTTEGYDINVNQITLTGTTKNCRIVRWDYCDPSDNVYKPYLWSDNTGASLIVKPEHEIFDEYGAAKVKLVTSESSVYDIFSIIKIYDGRKGGEGDQGKPGNDGKNAYTVVLSNESHTFPGDAQYAIQNSQTTTSVEAFLGATKQNVTVEKVGGQVPMADPDSFVTTTIPGLAFSVQNNGTTPIVTFKILSNNFNQIGTISIEVSVGEVKIIKAFSWAIAHTGSGASSLSIIPSCQVFKSSNGQDYSPTEIILFPSLQNLQGDCQWFYSIDGGSSFVEIDSTTKSTVKPYISDGRVMIPNNWGIFTSQVSHAVIKCAIDDFVDIVTISRLTDGKSAAAAYTAILSNELQIIPVDYFMYPLSHEEYECRVVVYKGTKQLTATMNSPRTGEFKIKLPSPEIWPEGVVVSQPTPGIIMCSVDPSREVDAVGIIDLMIDIEGNVDSMLMKTISLGVSRSGQQPLSMDILANPIVCFDENNTSTILTAEVFYGSENIDADSYTWKKHTSSGYVNIEGGVNKTLQVTRADVTNVATYKCEISYKGLIRTAFITLQDKVDPYYSEMLTIGGTTFKNGQGGSFVYVKVRTNGEEVDAFAGKLTTDFGFHEVPGEPNEIVYHLSTTGSGARVWRYEISSNGEGKWSDKKYLSTASPSDPWCPKYNYTWSLMSSSGEKKSFADGSETKTGKIIRLSCDDIDGIGTLQCDVSRPQ